MSMIGSTLEGLAYHHVLLKYSETAGVETAVAFLRSQNYDEEKITKIAQIIEGVGFKNELAKKTQIFPELTVVQDADRLDGKSIQSLVTPQQLEPLGLQELLPMVEGRALLCMIQTSNLLRILPRSNTCTKKTTPPSIISMKNC